MKKVVRWSLWTKPWVLAVDLGGEDVISRIGYATSSPEHYQQIREAPVPAVRRLAAELTAAEGLHPSDIVDVTIAGNTAARALASRLDLVALTAADYVERARAVRAVLATVFIIAPRPETDLGENARLLLDTLARAHWRGSTCALSSGVPARPRP